MKAIIVKKIETEIRDVPNNSPVYREAVPVGVSITAINEGEVPPESYISQKEVTYTRSSIVNPETYERKEYFVKTDEQGMWDELLKVSDSFINSKIEKGIREFRDTFLRFDLPQIEESRYKSGFRDGYNSVKKLPLWRRILNLYPNNLTTK